MKLSRIVLLSWLFSYSSQVVPSMPETHLIVVAIGGVFGGIGIKSTYDYFQREDASQKALQEATAFSDVMQAKYSKTCAVLAQASLKNIDEEQAIVQLFRNKKKKIDIYFDELGKDIYAFKRVSLSTLDVWDIETNEEKKIKLGRAYHCLKKFYDPLITCVSVLQGNSSLLHLIIYHRDRRE